MAVDTTFVIDVIFASINFAILIALAVYGFYVYALPGIRAAIKEQNAEHDALIAQRTQLREACRHVEDQIAQQEDRYHQLYDITTDWARIMHESQQRRNEMYQKRYEIVRDRRHMQQRNRIERKLLKQHIPDAFAQAQHVLYQKYQGDAGISYIQSVVKQVERHDGEKA